MSKKDTKKFTKKLRKQIDAVTAGTRYTLDAATGAITKDDPTPKKSKNKGKEGKNNAEEKEC